MSFSCVSCTRRNNSRESGKGANNAQQTRRKSKLESLSTFEIPEPKSQHGLISLSKNGLKSKSWGQKYWMFYFSLAYILQYLNNKSQRTKTGLNLLLFFFQMAPGLCLPCIHCRNSHIMFVNRPVNSILSYVQANQLPLFLYVLKNNVNHKLQKGFVPYEAVKRFYHENHNLWQQLFWYWLYCQVVNYPVDVSWNALCGTKELKERCIGYVNLIEQIKNILPKNSRLCRSWTFHYFQNPPTVYTFQSREDLFVWTYNQQVACNNDNHHTTLTLEQTGKLFEYERASNCAETGKTCK